MKCSNWQHSESKVVDSRSVQTCTSISRRRECLECSFRFTTYEYVFPKKIVIKKNGVQPLVVLDAEVFFDMMREVNDG